MPVYFTKEHEWIRVEGDTATVGISNHAQEALGDIVFAEVPEAGRKRQQGAGGRGGRIGQGGVGRLCAGLRRSDRGQSGARGRPGAHQQRSRRRGWFFKLKLDDAGELDGLMDEAAYRDWVKTL